MYLQGILTIDPAQLTQIDRVQPTKGFARMAYFLTGGVVAAREERETFCAVTLLQQINKVMRSVGVNNVVKLATDTVVFYEDTEGREDDLKQALDAFAQQAKSEAIVNFKELVLVLEHHLDDMACLIDIRIARSHPVGEYPIRITLNGMPTELSARDGEKQVRDRMAGIFDSQRDYDAFLAKYQERLLWLLDQIETSFHEHMRIDNIEKQSRVKIIRPKNRVASRDTYRSSHSDSYIYDDPIYYGYHGYDDVFFYSWLWSDMMHENHIHCHNCVIVDEKGDDVLDVGDKGFVAGEGNNTLNAEEPFSLPDSEDVILCSGHDYGADIDSTRIDAGVSGEEGGGWLSGIADSFSDSFSGGDDSGCSGSSCGSSCGGCGGD